MRSRQKRELFLRSRVPAGTAGRLWWSDGRAEQRGLERRAGAAVQAVAAAGAVEALPEQVGIRALATHAPAEGRVVFPAAADLADAAHDVFGAQGILFGQPVLEQRADFVGQAQHCVAGPQGAGLRGRLEDGLEFVVVERGNDRREHHGGGNARFGQTFDGRQPAAGRRRARLHAALELVVQRGDAQRDLGKAQPGKFAQQVQVAFHQRGLGDDRYRVAGFEHDLEQRARRAQLLLERLVAVGVYAQGDRRASVSGFGQFLPEQLRGVGLVHDLGLEIETGRKVEIGVRGAREAVDATVLAALVGIDGLFEADVRGLVAADDGLA